MKFLSDRSLHRVLQGLALQSALSSDLCFVTCFGRVSLIKILGSRVLVYDMGFRPPGAGRCLWDAGFTASEDTEACAGKQSIQGPRLVWVLTSTSSCPSSQGSLSFVAYIIHVLVVVSGGEVNSFLITKS